MRLLSTEEAAVHLINLAQERGLSWGGRSVTSLLMENRRSAHPPSSEAGPKRGNSGMWGRVKYARRLGKVWYWPRDLDAWFDTHAESILAFEKRQRGAA